MGRDELREVLLRQVDSDHLAALIGHAQGRGETDTAAGAGDDDGAAGEASGNDLLPVRGDPRGVRGNGGCVRHEVSSSSYRRSGDDSRLPGHTTRRVVRRESFS